MRSVMRKRLLAVSVMLPFTAVSGVASASHNYQHRLNEARTSSEGAANNAQARWRAPGIAWSKAPPSHIEWHQRNY